MNVEENFVETLQNAYDKTLRLAVGIAQNKAIILKSSINGSDLKFVKRIEKECKEFKELSDKRAKKSRLEVITESTLPNSKLKYHSRDLMLPKNSGKARLNISLEERKKFVSGSKAGKPVVYSEIGPNILEKLKTNTSIFSEENNKTVGSERLSTLPHVSMLTGKLRPALELSSFKEYVKFERSKEPKDVAFEKITQCSQHLVEFEKEMSGLEIFVNGNPGVRWNNDKSILLRLNAFPNQKVMIIKAYNDQNARNRTHKLTKNSTKERNEYMVRGDKFLSKTPNPKSMAEYYFPEKKRTEDAATVVRRCYSRFNNARERQNKKLISILDSLSLTRSVNLKQKAVYIMNDKEKFKDKSYSIQKMENIKKKIDAEQEIRLNKSKEQAIIYDRLMEFLKKKPNGPCDVEINFVEVLKEILEEGWYIDDSLILKIIDATPPEDINDLTPLLEYLRSEIKIIDKEKS